MHAGGAVLGERFELVGLAREGGMGSVYRARDRATGELVAIKIAHPQAMQHAERFAREAAVLSELRHPGIVRYVAHGRTDGGDLWLAMEWLDGEVDARFDVRVDARGSDRAGLFGIRASGVPSRTLLGRPTPFVGRARELGTLEAIFDACVAEGVAHAVLVEGPPGIGKSRLSWELAQRLRDRGEAVEIWTGRGDPMSAGSPFGLITQVLRSGLCIEPDDPGAVQHAKLRARVARLHESRDVARIVEFLGELLGAPAPGEPSVQLRAARQDPILMGDQMRRAFEDWLAAECASRPVVVFLEDLHWGDLPTVQFVDGALRHLVDEAGR